MKRNKTNLNFKNIFFFFSSQLLCAYPDFSARNSPWPQLSHCHFTHTSTVLCKAGFEADLCLFGPPDPSPARQEQRLGQRMCFHGGSSPLNPCGPLQPYAGRGMEPTSLVADLQQLCAPRGEQEGPAMQETGQGPAGRINLPLRQPPCPVHSHWLESPGR